MRRGERGQRVQQHGHQRLCAAICLGCGCAYAATRLRGAGADGGADGVQAGDAMSDYRMKTWSDPDIALRFLLTRIGSWTNARWDQWLRDEFGDERANYMIAELDRRFGLSRVP